VACVRKLTVFILFYFGLFFFIACSDIHTTAFSGAHEYLFVAGNYFPKMQKILRFKIQLKLK